MEKEKSKQYGSHNNNGQVNKDKFLLSDEANGAKDLPVDENSNSDDRQQLIDYVTNTIDYLRNRLECPVCLYTMEPPIYQCPEGHLICTTCKPKLKKCPECRVGYNTESNPFRFRLNDAADKRHRYAEKDAERLTETLAMLQRIKTQHIKKSKHLSHAEQQSLFLADMYINEEQRNFTKVKDEKGECEGSSNKEEANNVRDRHYAGASSQEFQTTCFQSRGLNGYQYWFRLKGESKYFFEHISNYGIASISMAKDMLIIRYIDGDTVWSEVPKRLEDTLKGRQSSQPKPNVISLGQRSDESYFIQFSDGSEGRYEWQDVPDTLHNLLQGRKHGDVAVIAIGNGDYFYVKFKDGHEEWNLPTPLENLLRNRRETRELAQVAYMTLSKQSDYAVKFTDGKWKWNQSAIFDNQDVKFIQSKSIANVVFGDGSDFIIMYKINSELGVIV